MNGWESYFTFPAMLDWTESLPGPQSSSMFSVYFVLDKNYVWDLWVRVILEYIYAKKIGRL